MYFEVVMKSFVSHAIRKENRFRRATNDSYFRKFENILFAIPNIIASFHSQTRRRNNPELHGAYS